MAAEDMEYSLEKEISTFFEQITVTRSACDTYAREHLGGNIIPLTVQGVFSDTVYAGSNAEFVSQFRLKSLRLKMEPMDLA